MSLIGRSAFGCAPVLALSAILLSGCAVAPVELSQAELSDIAARSIDGVAADQEPVHGAIDVYEAIARALKYNLDHQVELAEQSVRERELALSHYSMLPQLVANSGYAGRDSFNASSSENVLTGAQSLATSTSQDKRLKTADIAFSWNVLDFGLSYVRARQAADKVLVQAELRRKVTLRIVEETRSAYWKAVSAQRLLGRLARIEADARNVEKESRSVATGGQTSPITALTYEREIIEVQRTIGEVTRELNTAKTQLAALMNLPPESKFKLAVAKRDLSSGPSAAPSALIHDAVANRPELREVSYRRRINEQEAHAALLEMLPGISLAAGNNFDSNSFLFENHWQNWGAKASFNLLKVFSYPARRDVIEDQDMMLEKRQLAVTMAIMTQVYISRIRLMHAIKEYRTAQRYRNVQDGLLAQIRNESAAGRVSRQTMVREEVNTVVAEAKLDIAYAAVESARANMNTSLGIDPNASISNPDGPVNEIANALRLAKPAVVVADSNGN